MEQHNFQQIEDLNQRGGRTLSVVDLIEAKTLSLDMAVYLLCAVSNGASFLTAARPGGAGKTTLMACLLGFLKPGTRIVTVSDPGVLRAPAADPARPVCYLAHEIGSGHYYGYIWNQDVTRFLSLVEPGRTIASCLHADTLEELSSILIQGLRVPAEALARVDLLLFMHVDRSLSTRRRVATVYESASDSKHTLLYQWRPSGDSFEALGPSALLPRLAERNGRTAAAVLKQMDAAKEMLAGMVKEGERGFERVAKFLS